MQYKTKIILNFLLRKMSFENDLDNEKIYKINERYKHTNTTGNFWISNQVLINQYKFYSSQARSLDLLNAHNVNLQ